MPGQGDSTPDACKRGNVLFKNRRQAATLLAPQVTEALKQERDFESSSAVVVGVPRGGVLVAKEIALGLGCPLDVLVSKTIAAPRNPSFFVGAVSSGGVAVIDEPSLDYFRVTGDYLEDQKKQLTEASRSLEQEWLDQAGILKRSTIASKWVVVVADGVATGMNACTALRTMRMRGAGKLVLAAPVMSFHAYRSLKEECDQIIALCLPYDFTNIGQFYDEFAEIEDADVVSCLRQAAGSYAAPA